MKINYRTTDEIRKWAVALLQNCEIDDLDGGSDNNALYRSLTHGVEPIIERLQSQQQQAEFLLELLRNLDEPASHSCIVARTKRELDYIESWFQKNGVATGRIEANKADTGQSDVVKLATVHRVKGLEFDRVILASMNEGIVPLSTAIRDKADAVSSEAEETEERSLVYVAITRARKQAYITCYGKPSRFLSSLDV